MADQHDSSDQVDGGGASLGDAQSSNPPSDPEMLRDEPAEGEQRDGDDAPAGDRPDSTPDRA